MIRFTSPINYTRSDFHCLISKLPKTKLGLKTAPSTNYRFLVIIYCGTKKEVYFFDRGSVSMVEYVNGMLRVTEDEEFWYLYLTKVPVRLNCNVELLEYADTYSNMPTLRYEGWRTNYVGTPVPIADQTRLYYTLSPNDRVTELNDSYAYSDGKEAFVHLRMNVIQIEGTYKQLLSNMSVPAVDETINLVGFFIGSSGIPEPAVFSVNPAGAVGKVTGTTEPGICYIDARYKCK